MANVHKLKWRKSHNRCDFLADTVCGQYAVGKVHGRYTAMLRIIADGQLDDVVVAREASTAEAKIAAQKDFERKILSALAPTPPTRSDP